MRLPPPPQGSDSLPTRQFRWFLTGSSVVPLSPRLQHRRAMQLVLLLTPFPMSAHARARPGSAAPELSEPIEQEASAEPASTPPAAEPLTMTPRKARQASPGPEGSSMHGWQPSREAAEPPAPAAPAPVQNRWPPEPETHSKSALLKPSRTTTRRWFSPTSAAPAAGLSFLEQAAAQRQERQQELDRAGVQVAAYGAVAVPNRSPSQPTTDDSS